MWQQWMNVILGLWIILSGYVGMTAEAMATNLTISGLLIAGLALWGALSHRTMMREDHREHMHRHA